MTVRPLRPPPPGAAGGPMVNLPAATGRLILVCVAVHLVRAVMPPGLDEWVILNLSVFPAAWIPGPGPAAVDLVALVTHQFLHADLMHLLVNMVALAAFGSGLERMVGPRRLLAAFLVTGVIGAGVQILLSAGSPYPMVGASGAISGVFGAVLHLMSRAPLARRTGMRLVPAAAAWIGINIAFGLIGGPEGQIIAWGAHVGGFVAGLLLAPLFAPRPRAPD